MFAAAAALGVGGFVVISDLIGYRGRHSPWAAPMTLAEAWADPKVSYVAGIVFVGTFVVLAVRARARG